jgi:hypothetical protein
MIELSTFWIIPEGEAKLYFSWQMELGLQMKTPNITLQGTYIVDFCHQGWDYEIAVQKLSDCRNHSLESS